MLDRVGRFAGWDRRETGGGRPERFLGGMIFWGGRKEIPHADRTRGLVDHDICAFPQGFFYVGAACFRVLNIKRMGKRVEACTRTLGDGSEKLLVVPGHGQGKRSVLVEKICDIHPLLPLNRRGRLAGNVVGHTLGLVGDHGRKARLTGTVLHEAWGKSGDGVAVAHPRGECWGAEDFEKPRGETLWLRVPQPGIRRLPYLHPDSSILMPRQRPDLAT